MYVFVPLDLLSDYPATVTISGEDGPHVMRLNFAVQMEWLSYIYSSTKFWDLVCVPEQFPRESVSALSTSTHQRSVQKGMTQHRDVGE